MVKKSIIGGVEDDRDPVLVALGIRVRELRKASGLSVREFATAAGMSHAYVVTIEAGAANFSISVLGKIANILGVSIASFFEVTTPTGNAFDPVLSKMAAELRQIRQELQSRGDTIGTILEEIEARLEKPKEGPSGDKSKKSDGH